MFYSNAPRTLKEADERNNFYDGGMPYLNAKSSVHDGYRSSKWHDDDRMVALCIKVALISAIGGALCITITIVGMI